MLDRFLRCASLWADHIIIADQGSEDDTVAIARSYAKVTLVHNPDPTYDEGARQRLLLEQARRFPGPRILLALDADEILSANWMGNPEWQSVHAARPGTVIRLQWANLRPDLESCWVQPEEIPFGFVDDGSPHAGSPIHSSRLPTPPGAASLVLRDIKVLHYQYTDWKRMESKQRSYQCWERLQHPSRRPAHLYRQYHFMHAVAPDQISATRPEWMGGYQSEGIDMTSVTRAGVYYWDVQILRLLAEHGSGPFRRVDIWDVDWQELGERLGLAGDHCRDPRSWLDRLILSWLKATQGRPTYFHRRAVQWLLRLAGW